MVVLDRRVHRLGRYALDGTDGDVQTLSLFFGGRDPDERHDEGVEAVLAVARVAGAGLRDAAGADDLRVGVTQPAPPHAFDESIPDLLPRVPGAHAQLGHPPLEPVEVVFQTEEAAPPDVGHVVGRVRAQKAPVEDGDARLAHRHERAVDEGAPVREAPVVGGRFDARVRRACVHRGPLLCTPETAPSSGRERGFVQRNEHPRAVNAFICGVVGKTVH